jgi:hypothetical protein
MMKHNTLYLPGYSHRLCGRGRQSAAKSLADQAPKLDGLAALIARFIPAKTFALGSNQRDRIYSPWVTFCAFLGQVLQRGATCRDAVRRVQAWALATGGAPADDNTSGYCQARVRLSLAVLQTAFAHLADWCAGRTRDADRWQGRVVKVMDGCGLSMPDTPANRKVYPYAGGQKKGCGFPTGQLVGLFSLATGHLCRFVVSSWKAHEAPLARDLVGWVKSGEVLLADRAFCSWGLLALFHRKGVDVVWRLHQSRKRQSGFVTWKKPKGPGPWEKSLWRELPAELQLRIVRFRVETPGFRTEEITLVTTLLDVAAFPEDALADLFRRRWQVEICFRDVKTTLGLDVLRTLTPELIAKEIHLQAIAYNLVRALMLEAARQHDVAPDRLSFKGTISTLRAFATLFEPGRTGAGKRFAELLLALAADPVPFRPDRVEPRAVKRRPKAYQLLTRPRHQMVVAASRRCKK